MLLSEKSGFLSISNRLRSRLPYNGRWPCLCSLATMTISLIFIINSDDNLLYNIRVSLYHADTSLWSHAGLLNVRTLSLRNKMRFIWPSCGRAPISWWKWLWWIVLFISKVHYLNIATLGFKVHRGILTKGNKGRWSWESIGSLGVKGDRLWVKSVRDSLLSLNQVFYFRYAAD